jgi:hypothetical protein
MKTTVSKRKPLANPAKNVASGPTPKPFPRNEVEMSIPRKANRKAAIVLPFEKPKPKREDESTWSPYLQKRMDVLQAMCFSPDPFMTDCMAACLSADAETLAKVHWVLSQSGVIV